MNIIDMTEDAELVGEFGDSWDSEEPTTLDAQSQDCPVAVLVNLTARGLAALCAVEVL